MRFSHIADCHIGGWKDEKLRILTLKAFQGALKTSVDRKADFILISGDLFNTSLPEVGILKEIVKEMKYLESCHIPVYYVAGSHDFSPSGKTMLEVLEEAGLCANVVRGHVEDKKLYLRFTVDRKTGAKIVGMIGKRGMLERSYYETLDRSGLEEEQGFKIFMFHTAITELKPKGLERMDSSPVSYLPRDFDYYAGGHVHIVRSETLPGYRNIVYPGPLFPNTFRELEELRHGGFYFYDEGSIEYIPIVLKQSLAASINAEGRTPEDVQEEIYGMLNANDLQDRIVLLRCEGTLSGGKTSDIDWKRIYDKALAKDAYYVMRNTYGLKSKEYEEIKVKDSTVEEIEAALIDEQAGKIKVRGWDIGKEKSVIRHLISALSLQKKEGERVLDYEDRIVKEGKKIVGE